MSDSEHGRSNSKLETRNSKLASVSQSRPLGLLSGVELSAQQLRALRAIEAYDLSPIRARLVEKGLMTPGWADEAIFEFRRYLGLRAVRPEPITMLSGDVDEVWHTCLIFTRLYADLCQQVFGGFFHHDPTMEAAGDRKALWLEFEAAYRQLYGDPGPFWLMWRPLD